jgi:hypothetical protein
LKEIKDTNAKNLGYTFGINQFTDLTPKEFQEKHLMDHELMVKNINSVSAGGEHVGYVPRQDRSEIDWKPYMSEIRNQGGCGSCWAFATAGIVESNWWKANQKSPKVSLAPQELVDCDTRNGGCNGGWYNAALEYSQGKGLSAEVDYPYKAVKATACSIKTGATKYKIDSYKYCNSCTIDQWWSIFSQGPIAIAIDANKIMSYRSGILPLTGCGQINHAIMAVGWAKDAAGEILTIRNSWGSTWGEAGFARFRVNLADNTCSCLTYAYVPVVGSNPGPTPPPPPPTPCFDAPATALFQESWKLISPFTGGITFTATGLSFNVYLHEKIGGNRAYAIYFSAGNVSTFVVAGSSTQASCSFPYLVNPNYKNTYKISFNKATSSITITVNEISFVCKESTFASTANYWGFHSNGASQAKICDVSKI